MAKSSSKKVKKAPCVACNAEIKASLVFCNICGAPQKDVPACPHCRGKGGLEPDDEYLLVCRLCGGPRVPLLPGEYETTGGEKAALQKAETARRKRGLWRGGAVVTGALIPFAALVTTLFWWLLGTGVGFLSAAFFVGPLALALWVALRQTKKHAKDIAPAIDEAWMSTAADIADQHVGRLRAYDLAKILDVDRARAEQLHAMLNLEDILSTRARVTVAPDARFDALEDAQARLSHAKTQVADPAHDLDDDVDDAADEDEADQDSGEEPDEVELGKAAKKRLKEQAAIEEAIAEAEAEAELEPPVTPAQAKIDDQP